MRGGERVETASVVVTRQVITGSLMVVVAGFAAAVLFPAAEPVRRVLVLAIVSGWSRPLLPTGVPAWA